VDADGNGADLGPVVGRMNDDQRLVRHVRERTGHKWRQPSVVDCERFILQELGELSDALMRAGYADENYARNHQRAGTVDERVRHELGDVIMMVVSLCNLLELDASELLRERMDHILEKYGGERGSGEDSG
jgi:NTP pyrophosphatase (non-canonical NTP hydrolase)